MELIFIDPRECRRLIPWGLGNELGLHCSGQVVHHLEWNMITDRVDESDNINKISSHWVGGVPWEKIGTYKYVMRQVEKRPGFEGCFTRKDVEERYRCLDLIFEEAKRSGRLRTRKEIDSTSLREEGGVLMHIGPGGEPIFGGAGFHRFAIARILHIPLPCVVGTVDRSALPVYPRFRSIPLLR